MLIRHRRRCRAAGDGKSPTAATTAAVATAAAAAATTAPAPAPTPTATPAAAVGRRHVDREGRQRGARQPITHGDDDVLVRPQIVHRGGAGELASGGVQRGPEGLAARRERERSTAVIADRRREG